MRLALIVLPLLALLPSTAHAQASQYEQVRGWTITQAQGECVMAQTFSTPGGTVMGFSKKPDGTRYLSLLDSGWDASDGQTYRISAVLDGTTYRADARGGKGVAKRGYSMRVPESFESHFRAGNTARIFLGEELLGELSLAGTSAALDRLNRCVASLEQAEQARL